MTSAARPTWAPAKGSEDQGGTRMFGPRSSYSSKDAPAHTKLKYREVGQEGPLAAKNTRDLKRELLQKEAKHFKIQADGLEHRIKVPGVVDAEFAATGELLAARKDADADEDFDFEDEKPAGKGKGKALMDSGGGDYVEAGRSGSGSGYDDDDGDESSSEDDSDDEAELLAELERIKQERAEEKLRKQKEEKEEELESQREEILRGNPLLQLDGDQGGAADQAVDDFSIKRRW
eukprot:CAMPEP_0197472708 /NCGR_PEP_ID=MMETSP1309-20131121/3935_1 /TAXON_ID=464262 /ORGANISM="Genus nov. species nov., Strain RCC998" /LENGTH=232 /DNA_ID=CAMNT_0043011403 /DNA_START=54 /DNA_END=749 /DNA_ORIENTATION=+